MNSTWSSLPNGGSCVLYLPLVLVDGLPRAVAACSFCFAGVHSAEAVPAAQPVWCLIQHAGCCAAQQVQQVQQQHQVSQGQLGSRPTHINTAAIDLRVAKDDTRTDAEQQYAARRAARSRAGGKCWPGNVAHCE